MKSRAIQNWLKPGSLQKRASGFTVLEALIAGLVIAAVMTAVGRLGVSAMATSRNQSSRNTIEAAINNHIQLVQMQDSYLTKDAIEDQASLNTTLELACQNPSTFLMEHLQKPEVVGLSPDPAVSIEWDDSDPNLLVLTYSFEGPESSIGTEKRIAEVNPNFSSQCYDLQ